MFKKKKRNETVMPFTAEEAKWRVDKNVDKDFNDLMAFIWEEIDEAVRKRKFSISLRNYYNDESLDFPPQFYFYGYKFLDLLKKVKLYLEDYGYCINIYDSRESSFAVNSYVKITIDWGQPITEEKGENE